MSLARILLILFSWRLINLGQRTHKSHPLPDTPEAVPCFSNLGNREKATLCFHTSRTGSNLITTSTRLSTDRRLILHLNLSFVRHLSVSLLVDSHILSGKRWDNLLGISLVTLQNRWATHSTTVSIFLCWLPTKFQLGFIMQVLIQKPWKGQGPAPQPATFFFTSACIISESVSVWGFQKSMTGLVCRRPTALGFAPSRDTSYSYLILIRSSSFHLSAQAALLTADWGIPGNFSS